MQEPNSRISDLILGDSRSAILSLQFLDEVIIQDTNALTNQNQTVQTHYKENQFMYKFQYTDQLNYHKQQQMGIQPTSEIYQTERVQIVHYSKDEKIQSREVKEIESGQCNINQSEAQEPVYQYPDLCQSLVRSDFSKQLSKHQSKQIQEQYQVEQNPMSELNSLKKLQQQSMAEIQDSEHAEQIKQNFEALFQKVYGIIQQIQSRNEKAQLRKSQATHHLSCSARKELSLHNRVVELNLNKENDGLKKKFNNIQTEFDYSNDAYDEGATNIYSSLKTQQNFPKTPFNSSRYKPTSMLSLSKQFPSLVSPKTNNNTARSDRSTKSKGLTLVSAQKKLGQEIQVKKPVKITLMQKKIVPCPTKKVDLTSKSRADKKVTAFSPSNFFSSRRVSARMI